MAAKRKREPLEDDFQEVLVSNKKHTLDSDEEDSDDYEKVSNGSDIEGEEEGISNVQDEIKITPFNMREELEEGHFDTDGHYHWNKDNDIKDNWLDNVDWVKIKENKKKLNENEKSNDSNDSIENISTFNEVKSYSQILEYMKPSETVQKTLQRLGKDRKKMSSAERLKMKKMGYVDEAGERITKFTELTNELLTKTGNMDIYQKTFEQIDSYLKNSASSSNKAKSSTESFDMYADDFTEKEQKRIKTEPTPTNSTQMENNEIKWEFKWTQDDSKVEGPYSTKQMLKWSQENYFKSGVYVRKTGESTNFYTSNRIDFDLYL